MTVLYIMGVRALRRRGESWPTWRIVTFFVLGVLAYIVVNFGFLGTWSSELRLAFSTRTALLLFVVPALIAVGGPLTLARRVLTGTGAARLERLLESRVMRLLGNAMISPLIGLVVFSIFMIPFSGLLRTSYLGQASVTVLVPALGLLLVLPLIEYSASRSSFFVTVEFLLAFAELIVDAIPGIVVRLSTTLLDGVTRVGTAYPAWFPSPLRDQQLSGDLLWFIAELGDIPVLILLFIRWSRVDKKEATSYDDLSDEEMDRLTREHLRTRPE
jgi:putative membrane protein